MNAQRPSPLRSALPDPVRILVVNDREDQLLAIEAMLAPLGHELVAVTTGDDALRQLLQGDFAVILLDVNMPGMNGFEIAEASRLRPRSQQTPVIFVTASARADVDLVRGYDSGAFDFVHVPVEPAILRAKVQAFVRLHQMHSELRRQAEDLARLNGELQTRTRELAELNQDLGAFSYSVSHDLRAPLRRIEQFGGLLATEHVGELSDEGRRLLERIRVNASDMGRLIEALLSLSRIGRTELRPREVDLGAIAGEVLGHLREQEPARIVETVIGEGSSLRADPALLRVLLDNLLGNAWKFTARRPTARIEVGIAETMHHPRTCFVRDDGPGFDQARAEEIFAPFQRLSSAEEFAGSGIGLSIVARIVAKHGGKVWAESTPGAGATFFFTLG